MMLAGSLHVLCGDRPVRIAATDDDVVVHLRRWRDAWALRRSTPAYPLRKLLRLQNTWHQPLAIAVAGGRRHRLSPQPGLLARWLLPR